jgi:hypothetical protein
VDGNYSEVGGRKEEEERDSLRKIEAIAGEKYGNIFLRRLVCFWEPCVCGSAQLLLAFGRK